MIVSVRHLQHSVSHSQIHHLRMWNRLTPIRHFQLNVSQLQSQIAVFLLRILPHRLKITSTSRQTGFSSDDMCFATLPKSTVHLLLSITQMIYTISHFLFSLHLMAANSQKLALAQII